MQILLVFNLKSIRSQVEKMKIFIFLFLIQKLSAFPANDDRIYFRDSGESVSQSAGVSSRFDDDTDDLSLDLPSLFNDPNIMKSENDENGFEVEDQSSDEALYGKLYQGDIVLTDEQKKLFNTSNVDELVARTGRIHLYYRWPKDWRGKVIVPYVINPYDYSK